MDPKILYSKSTSLKTSCQTETSIYPILVICLLYVTIVNKSKQRIYHIDLRILYSESTPLKTPCRPLGASLIFNKIRQMV